MNLGYNGRSVDSSGEQKATPEAVEEGYREQERDQ